MATVPVPESDRSPFEADGIDRSQYIGGSQSPSLLNIAIYGHGCERELAYEKSGTPEDIPSQSAKQQALSLRGLFRRGHILENIFADLYMEKTHRTLIRRSRLIRHPDHPGAACHIDRLILKGNGRNTGIAEIKSHNEGVFLGILRRGLPPAHLTQLQWGLFCGGYEWGAFIVGGVFGDLPVHHFDVFRDEELMKIFANKVGSFWETLAKGELPPRLPDPKDLRCRVCRFRLTCRGEELDPAEYHRLLQEREGKRALVEITNGELDELLSDRALIRSEMQALDNDDEQDLGTLQIVNRKILELLGSTEAALVNKRWRVYATPNAWSGIDTKRLKQEAPEVYKKYFIERRPTGGMMLRVYAVGGNGKER